MSVVTPADILQFWFRDTPHQKWFGADPKLDAEIRKRFEEAWRAAMQGAFDAWAETKEGALALVLLLDQFPRNMFRGSADAFASDAKARSVAKAAIVTGFDRDASPDERNFLYLPWMHSEDLADQDESVRLTRERLGESHHSYKFAISHRDVIARFGRFPGRNAALKRDSTPQEIAFLAKNPTGF